MSIQYFSDTHIFKLDTERTSYGIGVTEDGYVGHLYYGPRVRRLSAREGLRLHEAPPPAELGREKLAFLASFPFEYPTGGAGDFRESCLDVISEQGKPGCELFYRDYRIMDGKPGLPGLPAAFGTEREVQTLELDLEDPVLGLLVTLRYSVFAAEDVIVRSVLVRNGGTQRLRLGRVLSASMDMDNRGFSALGMFGAWGRECHKESISLHHGRQVISSERGVSSPQAHPFIGLTTPGTDEEKGEIYAMNFIYSGGFLAEAELSMFDQLRVVMGIQPRGFLWRLAPGETFAAPEAVLTYSAEGTGRMTRNLHRFYREHLIRSPWKNRTRPILINHWEGTFFDYDSSRLIRIAAAARECGAEMFVMDDGWFGARDSDNAGLGDWFVNEEKLAGGICVLAESIRALGMKFGIWVEPEMVNPDSELFRAHPDWAIQLDGREPSRSRNQLVLDITRREVRDAVMEPILNVLHEAEADYVKWDMNRYLSDLGSAALDEESQGELLHRYVLGMYEMQERLLAEFPELLFENCSSGGARFDPGMLYYSPQIWSSDDTDAIERLRIQEGLSMLYPMTCMGAHVSEVPNDQVGRVTPLETRANVAMAGSFGYELDITRTPEEEKELMRAQVGRYHRYHPLYERGEYYRLRSWSEAEPFDCWMVALPDGSEALITYVQVLGRPNVGGRKIYPRGLDPEAEYRIALVSGEGGEQREPVRSGDELMRAGLLMPPLRDFESRVLHLVRSWEDRI
ncbi:alpha-galactosidase [Lachnoclostridium sp. Marseille-P6806]|uniref:alpha-galactosidase n=1 Tax=Lachnoclostridium sp. Marseille-P6806 TaxID=2364793 RepID=UPI0010318ED9|nr:alpha-galactosidase [Lachnoclostridium sp. Marseille-P6806]